MKQFLRYQISGTVFLIWIVVFYFSECATSVEQLLSSIFSEIESLKAVVGLISALPIGVVIHQVSVMLKNWVVAKLWEEFDDYPNNSLLPSKDSPRTAYILERISNLNSFYYVRFDTGVLAPLFAWMFVSIFLNQNIESYLIVTAVSIAIALNIYLVRIRKELLKYTKLINEREY